MEKFNKNDIIVFSGKLSLFNKNIILLYKGQGVAQKMYRLKLGDTFRVIDYSVTNCLILIRDDVDIEYDYWFYRIQNNDKNFTLKSAKVC